MTRKGFVIGETVQLIITLAAIFFVILIMYLIFQYGSGSPTVVCGTSAFLQELTSINTGVIEFDSPFPLYCPRKILTVEDKKIHAEHLDTLSGEIGNLPYSFYRTRAVGTDDRPALKEKLGKDPSERSEDLNAVFAGELEMCWTAFMSGERDFLDQESVFFRLNSCIICAEVHIDTDVTSSSQQLAAYLQSHYRPFTPDNETFNNYLYTTEKPSYSSYCRNTELMADFPIERDGDYAVIFLRHGSRIQETYGGERNPFIWLLTRPVNWAKATLFSPPGMRDARLGAQEVFGDYFASVPDRINECMTVGVVPVRDLPQYCHVVVN